LACHDILFTPKLANLSYYHLHPTHQRSLGNQITLSIYHESLIYFWTIRVQWF